MVRVSPLRWYWSDPSYPCVYGCGRPEDALRWALYRPDATYEEDSLFRVVAVRSCARAVASPRRLVCVGPVTVRSCEAVSRPSLAWRGGALTGHARRRPPRRVVRRLAG